MSSRPTAAEYTAEERRTLAEEVDLRLESAFGIKVPKGDRDVLHELIHAVLSQNTHRRNYNRAYASLMEAFPTLEELGDAPAFAVEEAIRIGGLSRQKSAAIKGILDAVLEEQGEYSLEFIRGLSVPDARAYLEKLPGVGPKSASVVLMFADGRSVFAVDTHVHRTAMRIGLIDEGRTAVQAQSDLEALVPADRRPSMHMNLVHLGREVCHARGPLHEICPLAPVCKTVRQQARD